MTAAGCSEAFARDRQSTSGPGATTAPFPRPLESSYCDTSTEIAAGTGSPTAKPPLAEPAPTRADPSSVPSSSHQEISSSSLSTPPTPPPTTARTVASHRPEPESARTDSQRLAQTTGQTQPGVRQRMTQAGAEIGLSLRQMYASASSITTAAAGQAAAAVAADVPPSYHNIPGIVPYYQGRTIGPPPSYDDVINPYAPPPSYQSLFGQLREARKTSRGLLDLTRRLLIILISTLGCTLLIGFMILIPFTMIIVGAIYIDECRIEHIPAFLLVGGLVWASKNIIHCYVQCRKAEHQDQADTLAAELYLTGSGVGGPLNAAGHLGSSLALSSSSESSTHSSSPTGSTGELAPTTINAPGRSGGGLCTLATPDGCALDQEQSSEVAASGYGGQQHRLHRNQHHQHQNNHNYNHNQRGRPEQQRNTSRLKSSICESLLNCVLFGWFIAGCVIVFRNYEPDFENSLSARYCNRTVYMYTFWLISSAILSFGLFIGCVCCLMVSSAIANRQSDIDLA